MKNITFKRALSNPSLCKFFHPMTVIQYWDTTIAEETNYRQDCGFEILPEDIFLHELSKNEALHDEFIKNMEAQNLSLKAAIKAEEQFIKEEDRKLEEEFKQFQKWKKKAKR